MTYNLLAYLIYGTITIYTIFYVGGVLHRNGRHLVLKTLGDEELGDYVNNALLAAYYLVNVGYVFITITTWEQIESFLEMVTLVGSRTGLILLLLGILHYVNILALHLIARRKRMYI